ncbi:TetR family transcriptional regulator [Erwinia sp. CPCC 100877]|nr:TetR family transcriptional regulator [Erwinia sp. CPCC 100877]
MPKPTFFHLSETKRQRLIAAAKAEFSRTTLQEASVANIVKLAEIPRGSFYQYFEDKEDLYYYYFNLLSQTNKRDIEIALKNADGDLFEAVEVYFTKMIVEVLTGENAAFYKQLFMGLDYRLIKLLSLEFLSQYDQHTRCEGNQLLELIDWSCVTIQEPQERALLLQMFLTNAYTSIAEGYCQLCLDPQYKVEGIVKQFKIKLNWLKQGVYQ